MTKHNPKIVKDFVSRMEEVLDKDEMEVLNVVNDTV